MQGDREEDFAYAVDLLKASGAHANYKYTAEQIFEATEKFARKKGADEFSAPLTAQILAENEPAQLWLYETSAALQGGGWNVTG